MTETGIEQEAPVKLAFDCQIKWQDMSGGDQVRYCEQCKCSVQDISDFSKEQVAGLQQRVNQGEKICVSFRKPKALRQQSFDLEEWKVLPRVSAGESIDLPTGVYSKLVSGFTSANPAFSLGILVALSISLSSCSMDSQLSNFREATGHVVNRFAKRPVPTKSEVQYLSSSPEAILPTSALNDHSVGQIDGFYLLRHRAEIPFLDAVNGWDERHVLESYETERKAGKMSVKNVEILTKYFVEQKQFATAHRCYLLLITLAIQDRNYPRSAQLKSAVDKLIAEHPEAAN